MPLERRRVALVVGPSAQYLAPFIDPEPELNALVEDPVAAMLAHRRQAAVVAIRRRNRRPVGPPQDANRAPGQRAEPAPRQCGTTTPSAIAGRAPDAGIWRELLFDDVLTRAHAYPAEEAALLSRGSRNGSVAAKPGRSPRRDHGGGHEPARGPRPGRDVEGSLVGSTMSSAPWCLAVSMFGWGRSVHFLLAWRHAGATHVFESTLRALDDREQRVTLLTPVTALGLPGTGRPAAPTCQRPAWT